MAQSKAYGLLSEQPLSAIEIALDKRQKIVISAITDKDGKTVVLSRYGDPEWKLWPFFTLSNERAHRKIIKWSSISESFREVCKSVTYRYWMVGRPGTKKPGAATLRKFVEYLSIFTRYLDSLEIRSMADVHSIHITNYVHMRKVNGVRSATLTSQFSAIELLYHFADQHSDGLSFHPWPESSACEVAGSVGHAKKQASRTGKTPLIPKEAAQKLFCFAEQVLAGADAIMDERYVGQRDAKITLIRNACFYLLGVLTGMRCEELVGIEVGAGRIEVKDGITYHWVTSVEHKTGKGRVEYLMPSMGHEILRVIERWSSPFRKLLREQMAELEADASEEGLEDRLECIASMKADLNRVFIGLGNNGIGAVAGGAWAKIMPEFAVIASADWKLAPHQMRRLYAWTFVRHRLGNLLFVKDQFKHSTLDMTQLYGANPLQDTALYDEILDELRSQKTDIIQGWLFDDEPLSGGAGKKIMELRAHDFPNRAALIEETADKLNIRSTGHGWCLTQDEGCGGSGLYERVRCGGCGNGLIDASFKPVWQEIYRHQVELLEEVQELGQGAIERVHRDLEKAKTVLIDLGIEIEGALHEQSAIV